MIVYCCPFVPPEWIEAHDLETEKFVPGEPSSTGSAGACAYAADYLDRTRLLTKEDGVIFTTLCDQMRRAAEIAERSSDAPVFLMHVPATWRGEGPRTYYREELIRLGRYLVSRGGNRSTAAGVAEIMQHHDDRRAKLRGAQSRPRKGVRAAIPAERDSVAGPGVPLAVIGGHVTGFHQKAMDFIEQNGCIVAYDGADLMPGPFDMDRANRNPLEEIVRAYFDSIPHPFRRPDDLFFDEMEREIAQRNLRGIILLRQVWCDTWHGEVARMKERLNIPVLDVEIQEDERVPEGRALDRIAAFLEIVR
jgi:benzoyl-CoA reductase/2-hydroxyglutaryl-CoA dehydratase subunit BcrC/BadD/HgdB